MLEFFFWSFFLISISLSWKSYFGVFDEKVIQLENVYLSPNKGRNGPAVIQIISGGSILYTAQCTGLEFSVCRPSVINKGGVYAKNVIFLDLIDGDGVILEANNQEEYIKNEYPKELAIQKYLNLERKLSNFYLILSSLFLSIHLIYRFLIKSK